MNNKGILLLSALGLLSACGNNAANTTSGNPPQEVDTRLDTEQAMVFDRLVGLWKSEDGTSYERWRKNADGSYLAVGFQVNNADTVYSERVYIHRENGQWVSENTVPGQNEGKAIPFAVTKLTSDEVHFSNPAHDFPTDIHYHLSGDNAISAYITGPNQSGGFDTIPFDFVRAVDSNREE